ncbi:MAG: 2,3,4,5-tetrahydropyridine-2,6-carboxylate N-succinyltransferase, partial [Campylobacter lanienae]|nr:2,3,4,5-tetrahydropyridine-2,6-carboxylate N-succinyltransferase [Campylobacter lanienae]
YKASQLANLNGIHYRQNSQTGQITANISKRAIKLNTDLH